MRRHHSKRPKEDGVFRHPADAEEWKQFDRRHPSFALEPINVRLGLATDGFHLFGNMSNSYRRTVPGNNMDIFMRPLIDEWKELWESGVQAQDAYNGTVFTMRVANLWTINDFPAYALMSGWSTKGYKACPTCNKHTPSIGLHNKIGYVGHRKFLEMDDPRQRSKKYAGKIEKRPPSSELSGEHRNELQLRSDQNLDTVKENKFPSWFKSRINQLQANNPGKVFDELNAITNSSNPTYYCYPRCIVNSVKFLVEDRDDNCTPKTVVFWCLEKVIFKNEDDDETTTIQERNSSGIQLVVQLSQLDDVEYVRDDVNPIEVTSRDHEQPHYMPVMTQVLGEWTRHLRGMGQLSRLMTGAKRATPRAGPLGQPTATLEEYEALRRRVEEQEARNEWQQQMMQTQNQIMRVFQQQMMQLASFVLGFNMPPMPLILPISPFRPPGTGSFLQNALLGDDNDNDDAVDL
uniref:Transposase-associated domain-containing protein n=1 Tax=Cannabis sativa TaxID=3483 RepID=A0A803NHQ2_CANSA